MSPITPPLAPAQPLGAAIGAAGNPPRPRQPLTHSSQPSQQMGIPPPHPEPIDFESNPDVIALKSAISVLQVQKGRATRDIQDLSRIRAEALADPEAFIKDLAAGNVKPRDDSAFVFGSDDSDQDSQEKDNNPPTARRRTDKHKHKHKHKHKPRAWSALPKPQNVVRCPPINWAQYAVVGESLDKLHAEQVSRPSQGTPAVLGPGGLYRTGGEGAQETYNGVAAPYDPARDAIDRKPKSS
ncbi:hypothetical protein E4U42_003965 [Claviceps africana]|uniref:Uncharacterized protein n=1 Tax=Claviceps africana TaxID=83212 RepID=A0A8K0NLI8_9HYPO|nr:hypothetical protein E4U42_003965 [Claviceps africana]